MLCFMPSTPFGGSRANPLRKGTLSQRVHRPHQIGLRRHHRVDALVGGRRLVEDARILAAFDVPGRRRVLVERDRLLAVVRDSPTARP
jgi:hypothetical protein